MVIFNVGASLSYACSVVLLCALGLRLVLASVLVLPVRAPWGWEGDRDRVGNRGSLRARSLSHTIPLPLLLGGGEAF